MELTKETIKEFQEIYKKEFGEEINEVVARERARRLLELLKVVYRPLSKHENGKLSNN